MAIPALSLSASKAPPAGKATSPSQRDQDKTDFASALAQQTPPSKAPAASATQPAKPAPDSQPAPTPGEQAIVAETPPGAAEHLAPTTGEKAIAAESPILTAEELARGAADGGARGGELTPAIAQQTQEAQDADRKLRGIANALAQTTNNPGRALGLSVAQSNAAEPATGTAEKGPRKEATDDTAATPLPDASAQILAVPLTQPPISSRQEAKVTDTALAASTPALPGALPETSEKTANLAGEAAAGTPTAVPPTSSFAAALAERQVGPMPQAATPPAVAAPLHGPEWSRSFGEGIVWMARNEVQSAQINITPPQLGPIQITLHLNGDQASAAFASPHAEVRQAIQDALPQLREMLANSGIDLGRADVGSQGSGNGHEFAMQRGNQNRSGSENAILPPDTRFADSAPVLPIQRGRGLVDLFA